MKHFSVKTPVSTLVRMTGYMVLIATLAACSPQASEDELLTRARFSLDEGNLRMAVIDVKTALQQNADNAEARRLLGEIYLFQQSPAAAVEEFERALRTASDDELLVLYARALLSAGRGEHLLGLHAGDSFTRVDDNPQYLAALALAQAADNESTPAQKSMDAALAVAPDDPYVTTSNAFFLLRYSGALEAAKTSLHKTLALHPEYAEGWGLLGDIQQMEGELELAEASYEKVADLNPFRLTDRLNLVSVRLDQGKTEEAKLELDRLQASNPNHLGVKFAQGRILLESGDNAAALEAFSAVLNALPAHPGGLYLSAVANIREGHFSTALDQLDSLLVAQPRHLNGRLQLSSLHLRMSNPEVAATIARDILQDQDTNYLAMELLAAALDAQGLPGESADIYQQLATAQPQNIRHQLALGSALVLSGDRAAGVAALQAARDLDPTSAAAQERLIHAYLSSGDTAAAKAEIDAYAAREPKSPRPSLFLGRMALLKNDKPTAARHFERALELEPGNVIANSGLAVLAAADKDMDQARARYMDALEHHPDDTASLLNLASIEEARGDLGAMQSALETAVSVDAKALAPRLTLARLKLQEGKNAEALRQLLELRDEYPRDPALWLLLTQAHMAVGDLDSAQEASEQLLTLMPGEATGLATAARLELRRGQFGVAETHLEQALETQPDNLDLRKLMIDALVGQGKLQEASEILESLPEPAASEPAVLVAKGRIALAEKNPAEAEPLLRSAMAASPNAMTMLWLSGSIAAQGRSEEALTLLTDWLADKPEDMLVRNQLASTYLQQGRERESRDQYVKILEKIPDNVLILNNLAWLFRADDSERALRYIEKANGLAPDNPQVKDTYAMIQLERKAIRESLSLNQKALDLLPDNPEILYHRAMILHADGQAKDAIRILEQLIKSEDFAQKDEARTLLTELQGS